MSYTLHAALRLLHNAFVLYFSTAVEGPSEVCIMFHLHVLLTKRCVLVVWCRKSSVLWCCEVPTFLLFCVGKLA